MGVEGGAVRGSRPGPRPGEGPKGVRHSGDRLVGPYKITIGKTPGVRLYNLHMFFKYQNVMVVMFVVIHFVC